MDIIEIIPLLYKRDLSKELIKNYLSDEKFVLSNAEKKQVRKYIEECSFNGKYFPTINCVILGLLYDRKKTIDTIKRKGILRYSKYLETKNFPEPLSKQILGLSSELRLTNTELQYFESILNLSPIYKILKALKRNIVREINKFSKRPKILGTSPSIIKTLLAQIDYLFLVDYHPDRKNETTKSIKYYLKEEIAEAISYIIYLKQQVFGFNDFDSYVIDEEYIVSRQSESIILSACHQKALQEIEIRVDHFSFTCSNEKNRIIISPPNQNFEKSLRLGYIRHDLQKHYDFKEIKHASSLEDLCDRFMDTTGIDVFKFVVDHNYPRYRIELPEPIFDILSKYFFAPKELFKEEAQYLSLIFKEQLLDYNKLSEIKISENLSLLDYFVLKRLFIFFFHIFKKNVLAKLNTETNTILRSLIPTFTKEKLEKFYKGIISEEALNEFLNIVTWNPNSDTLFDIQYQSFIKLKSDYMIPVCTYVNSDTIRNVFASEYKLGNPSIMDSGEYDPISEALEKAFSQANFTTFKHISHSYKQGGEIDFLAFKDDFLIIVECKKFLHPTSVYDQRTIYDGLLKATRQLDLIKEAIRDNRASKGLSDSIGEDVKKFKTLKTAVVTNTRLFGGLMLNDHPIRNIYEFFNFLVSGNFKFEDDYYWFWEKDDFTINDLERYLGDSFPLFMGLYNAMLPKEIQYEFDKIIISLETFVMDVDKANNFINDFGMRKVE